MKSLQLSKIKSTIECGNLALAYELISAYCPTDELLDSTELRILRLLYGKIQKSKKFLEYSEKQRRPLTRAWHRLSVNIRQQKKLTIVLLNDNGFVAGAGVGAARQVQCFLKHGWDVIVVATHFKPKIELGYANRYTNGKLSFIDICDDSAPILRKPIPSDQIVSLIQRQSPDLVLTGNFHATGIDLDIVDRLTVGGIPVVVYAHDCDWVTGGCAHFLYHGCNLYISGCLEAECKKKGGSYPPLYKPVSEAWEQRGRVLNRKSIPIAVNSRWSKKIFKKRFPQNTKISLVHLGVDKKSFTPLNKENARKEFGIDIDKFVVLAGVGSFSTRGKGGEVLKKIFEHFAEDHSVLFVFFGHVDQEKLPENVMGLGYLSGEDELCKAYSAADIFLNPVSIESFGQTMLEASSCGLPLLGLDKTGVKDIIFHGLNGFFCDESNIITFAAVIKQLQKDPATYNFLSQNSILVVDRLFSHQIQFRNWCDALIDMAFSFLTDERLSGSSEKKKSDDSNVSISKMPKKISVVTVTYNVGDEFVRTAESILEQKCDLEWVIIDGCSSDPYSCNIIERYAGYADVYVSEPDEGIYDAMNKAVQFCNGEYVVFLGSGDFFVSDSSVHQIVREIDGYDLLVGNVVEVRTDGQVVATNSINPLERLKMWKEPSDLSPPLKGMPPHQSTVVRTSLSLKYGFSSKYKVCADWDQVFRICTRETDIKVHLIDQLIAWYPNGGYSATRTDLWLKEAFSIVEKYCDPNNKYESIYSRALSNQYRVVSERVKEGNVIEPIAKALGRS